MGETGEVRLESIMMRKLDPLARRSAFAKVVAVLVAMLVVAGGGALAWYLLDKPAGDILDPEGAKAKREAAAKKREERAERTEASKAKTPSKPRPRIITNSLEMKFAFLPAGKFRMGSPDGEKGRDSNEGPAHEVEITAPFYIGVHEVTQSEFAQVMGRNTSSFSFERGNQERLKGVKNTLKFPVDSVTWTEANEFCLKLNDRIQERNAARVYRLPTEAEWEYACRAGTTTATSFGDSLGPKQANFNGEQPYGEAPVGPNLDRTSVVGSYPSNDFGLHDMHGNLYEWCQDIFGPYPAKGVKDPMGPEEGDYRVLRGGSWHQAGQHCRSASRLPAEPSRQEWYIGFRVVIPGGP